MTEDIKIWAIEANGMIVDVAKEVLENCDDPSAFMPVLTITRTIPPPLYLNGYAAMEFVHMLEQLRETEEFDPQKGLKVTVEQEDE